MNKYILNLNQQSNSSGHNYEIHNVDNLRQGCNAHLIKNKLDLGQQIGDFTALRVAQQKRPLLSDDIDSCYWCCRAINSDD